MSINFLDIPIVDVSKIEIFASNKRKPVVFNFVNAWSFYCYYHLPEYRAALQESLNFPDGMSIAWGLRFLDAIKVKRYTGYDILLLFLQHAGNHNISNKVLFIGSTKKVQRRIKLRLSKDFPQIQSSFILLPFRERFRKADVELLLKEISTKKPEIIFVGLSAPKQEIFTHKYLKNIEGVRYICNVGAAFEFYGKTEPRAPKWIQDIGFEGIFRTIFHPIKHIKKDIKSFPFLIKTILNKKI